MEMTFRFIEFIFCFIIYSNTIKALKGPSSAKERPKVCSPALAMGTYPYIYE
jgi:hypothetical protein